MLLRKAKKNLHCLAFCFWFALCSVCSCVHHRGGGWEGCGVGRRGSWDGTQLSWEPAATFPLRYIPLKGEIQTAKFVFTFWQC